MNGIKGLADAIKTAVQNRVNEEAEAKRGTIKDGKFVSGSKSYPFVQAVDCDVSNGSKVWAQLSKSGTAVVIGE